MTAVMFWLAVGAVATIGAGLFVVGMGVGFGIARRRYQRKPRRQAPDPNAVALFAALATLESDPSAATPFDPTQTVRRR